MPAGFYYDWCRHPKRLTMPFEDTFLTALLIAGSMAAWARTDLPVRYLGIEQGLSNNAILSFYQDHRGFMWIGGTYDGLNRYDGYNFRIFRNMIGDSTSLSTNNVYHFEGDAKHNIWSRRPKWAEHL